MTFSTILPNQLEEVEIRITKVAWIRKYFGKWRVNVNVHVRFYIQSISFIAEYYYFWRPIYGDGR